MEVGASSGGRFKLYDRLELQEFQDKFVIKAVESPDQGFSIDRRDGHTRPLNGTWFFRLIFRIWFRARKISHMRTGCIG